MAFQWNEKKIRHQGTEIWEQWSHFKVKLLTTKRRWEKIPPDHDWWWGQFWRPGASEEPREVEVSCWALFSPGTGAWDRDMKEILVSIFPGRVCLSKVRLVNTASLNWNQRDLALHTARQKVKTSFFFQDWRKKSLQTWLIRDGT